MNVVCEFTKNLVTLDKPDAVRGRRHGRVSASAQVVEGPADSP